jgi:hypothetical protein
MLLGGGIAEETRMPLTAEQRRTRARLAAAGRWHPDQDNTELAEDLGRARRDAQIAEMVATWPPLTDDQKTRLSLLLNPGQSG